MSTYIGIGSNLGNSFQYLQHAVTGLQQHNNIIVTAVSAVYQSKPHGPQNQPDYLNAVVEIDTSLSPSALLQATQTIENNNQRLRNEQHWGARTLDLDILLYGQAIIKQSNLTIPHPWIPQRTFVLIPLRDIVDAFTFPNGETLQSYINHCPHDDLIKTSHRLTIES